MHRLLIAVLALSLAACAHSPATAQKGPPVLEVVRWGMSQQEVERGYRAHGVGLGSCFRSERPPSLGCNAPGMEVGGIPMRVFLHFLEGRLSAVVLTADGHRHFESLRAMLVERYEEPEEEVPTAAVWLADEGATSVRLDRERNTTITYIDWPRAKAATEASIGDGASKL